MEKFGIPQKLVASIKMCMEDTQYKIRVEYMVSEAFEVRTGLKQVDALSPTLFNLALEKSIKELQLETTAVDIGQQHIQVLGFADDLNILGNSLETEKTAQALKQAATRIGLKINAENTKIMELLENGDNPHTESLRFKKVDEFRYLIATLRAKNDWSKEIGVRIIKTEIGAFPFSKFLKSKLFSKTKIRLCKTDAQLWL